MRRSIQRSITHLLTYLILGPILTTYIPSASTECSAMGILNIGGKVNVHRNFYINTRSAPHVNHLSKQSRKRRSSATQVRKGYDPTTKECASTCWEHSHILTSLIKLRYSVQLGDAHSTDFNGSSTCVGLSIWCWDIPLLQVCNDSIDSFSTENGLDRQVLVHPTPEPTPTEYCLDVPVLFYHHIQPLTMQRAMEDSLSVDPITFERHSIS